MNYYFFSSEECKDTFELFLANPDLASASYTWNLLETKMGSAVIRSVTPTVGTSVLLNLQKELPPITLENIDSLPKLDGWESLTQDFTVGDAL